MSLKMVVRRFGPDCWALHAFSLPPTLSHKHRITLARIPLHSPRHQHNEPMSASMFASNRSDTHRPCANRAAVRTSVAPTVIASVASGGPIVCRWRVGIDMETCASSQCQVHRPNFHEAPPSLIVLGTLLVAPPKKVLESSRCFLIDGTPRGTWALVPTPCHAIP